MNMDRVFVNARLGLGVDIDGAALGGFMRKLLLAMLLVLGTSTVALAFQVGPTAVHHAPEIDPSTGTAALTLIAGVAMIIRGRKS